jgi:hypothetical protein
LWGDLSFGSILNIWEKTCYFCLSEHGLLCLTLCPPIPMKESFLFSFLAFVD